MSPPHPPVTPCRRRARLILGDYVAALEELRRLLTPSICRVPVSAAAGGGSDGTIMHTLALAEQESEVIPECEQYRRFAGCILHRLRFTLREPDHADAYPGCRRLQQRPAADQGEPCRRGRGAAGPRAA